jgi:hypothetical protein
VGLSKEDKRKIQKGVLLPADKVWMDNRAKCSLALGKPVRCEYSGIESSEEIVKREGLFIAAPKDHFDLKGLKHITGTHGFFSTTRIHKDPIVFRYVKGGIQIISKWGLEASDPMLVNEINN